MDGIHSFKTSIQDGKIHVTAETKLTAKENKSRPLVVPSGGFVSAPALGKGVVIVGGGAGAIHAVQSLREVRSDVHLFRHDEKSLRLSCAGRTNTMETSQSSARRSTRQLIGVFYSKYCTIAIFIALPTYRTKLSKALIGDASKLEWRNPADLKIKYGANLRIGTVSVALISDVVIVFLIQLLDRQ